MTGSALLLYFVAPAVVLVTVFFLFAAVLLILRNNEKSDVIASKQDRIVAANTGIDNKVTDMHDIISNNVVPSIQKIHKNFQNLEFEPSIEKLINSLESIGIKSEVVSESGGTIGFAIGFEGRDNSIGYLFHFFESLDVVLAQSVSYEIESEKDEHETAVLLMLANSQLLVGNVFVERMADKTPVVANYSFSANKNNFAPRELESVIFRLAATHEQVAESLGEAGCSLKSLPLEEYLKSKNRTMQNE